MADWIEYRPGRRSAVAAPTSARPSAIRALQRGDLVLEQDELALQVDAASRRASWSSISASSLMASGSSSSETTDPSQPDRLAQFARTRCISMSPNSLRCRRGRAPSARRRDARAGAPAEERGTGCPRRGSPALRPDEPLGEGRLGDQEGARDLRRAQTAERAQGQRDAALHREGRMAAGEDQPQPVVGDRHVRVRVCRRSATGDDRREFDLDRRIARQLIGLVAKPAPPAKPVDRPVPGRGRDPCAGVRGHAPLRPDLKSGDEGVLDRFLGEVEVAEDADQGRDRPALFLAEQAVDELVGGGVAEAQPAVAPTDCWAWSADEKSMTGRTSIEPTLAPGHCAARSSASSRSLASTR